MTENESTEFPSSRIGTLKIPYSDLEKMNARVCQSCYHAYRDHTNENGETIPCVSCKEGERCENFSDSL